jgi:hypothetical protein
VNVHRMCAGKVRYGSVRSAKAAIARGHLNGAMRVYKCPLCPGYHVTSKEPKPDPAMETNQRAVESVRPLIGMRLSATEMAERTGLDVSMVQRAVAFLRREEARRLRAEESEASVGRNVVEGVTLRPGGDWAAVTVRDKDGMPHVISVPIGSQFPERPKRTPATG